MIEKVQDAITGNRIYFLDNLRTFMIFLVVLYHSGLVYENSGFAAFFWVVHDLSTNTLSSLPNLMIIDIFVMATIFFISGYLTPISLEKKTGWKYLKTKFKRLMIPWGLAVLTLMPLYKMIFLHSRNLPQDRWTTYFHWDNGFISQNWLWFLPVLFLFNVLYFVFARLNIKIPKITLKTATGGIFLLGFIYSFCMEIFNGLGWTKSILLEFQNERLLIYLMIFLLGSLCYKLRIFESKSKSKKLYIVILGTAWIPVILYRYFFMNSFMKPGNFIFSKIVDALLFWIIFHISLLCLLYLLINTFRYYLDKPGKISKELNQNSYNVYIIHTIVLGGIALSLRNTAIPSVLKFLILTVSTYAACTLMSSFYRKVIKAKIFIKRK